MRDLYRLFAAVLVLTFVGGMGVGAWVGTLTASPAQKPTSSPDRRLQDWKNAFPDLSATQLRQIRVALGEHDLAVRGIRTRVNTEQWKAIREREVVSRTRIRKILTPTQREEFDRRLKGLRDKPAESK